jgi:hypothetical protein
MYKETEMKTSRVYPYLLAALLLIVSLACVRSIPNPNATQPAEGTEEGQPADATDVMNQIFLFATQTAMSAGGATNVTGTTPGAQATPGAGETAAAGTPQATQPGQQVPGTAQPTQPPPAPATPLPVPPPLVVPATYTLQRGEFPFCIARRFNVDPGELLRINGLSSYSVYHTGMVLRIPQSGQPFPGNRALQPHPTTYTVGGGDTIHTIACAFGDVDPDAIAYVNGLTPPYRLSPGQVISIP